MWRGSVRSDPGLSISGQPGLPDCPFSDSKTVSHYLFLSSDDVLYFPQKFGVKGGVNPPCLVIEATCSYLSLG